VSEPEDRGREEVGAGVDAGTFPGLPDTRTAISQVAIREPLGDD
jgi:hypothetical protein